MLEKMAAFFERRLDGYDAHMLHHIEGAQEFYLFTAAQLPMDDGTKILDLGCGTGLELEEYFRYNPKACVTGVDLSAGMLEALQAKFHNRDITLLQGSYFDLPFGRSTFDAAVSVESLHHFTKERKTELYAKLRKALRRGGYFILTDYFAASDEEEQAFRERLEELKREQGIEDGEFYHFDTPLTVAHEMEALREAGFSKVEILKSWGATYTLEASR
jgi:tRNA (cmo5U34)-methyltransferase